jgi:hypothetical protein
MKIGLLTVIFIAGFAIQVSAQQKGSRTGTKKNVPVKQDTSIKSRIGRLPDTTQIRGLRGDTNGPKRRTLPPPGSLDKGNKQGAVNTVNKPGISTANLDTTKSIKTPTP